MNIVSAMALLSDGVEVRRAKWCLPTPRVGEATVRRIERRLRLVSREGARAVIESGTDWVYGRERSFGTNAYLNSDDMTAEDWEIALPAPPASHQGG